MFRDSHPDIGGIDIDIEPCELFLLLISFDTAVVEVIVQLLKVLVKFVGLAWKGGWSS